MFYFLLALFVGLSLIIAGVRLEQSLFWKVGVVFILFGVASLILGFLEG